jgi:hypothetical protein
MGLSERIDLLRGAMAEWTFALSRELASAAKSFFRYVSSGSEEPFTPYVAGIA